MALENTRTPGIYKFIGKRNKIRYRLLLKVPVPDPLAQAGYRMKMKVLTFAKEQDAISAKIKTQGEMRSGKYVEPGDLTVKELVEKWIEAGRTRGVGKHGPWKIQTYDANKAHLDRYIAPKLGELKASKLRKAAIEQAAAEWQEGTSAETANKVIATLNAAFKFALKDPDTFGVSQNPLNQVERLAKRVTPEELEERALGMIADHGDDQPERKRGTLRDIQPEEVYSALELKQIIDAAEPGLEKALLMTAIFTGLRHGELSALRWPMIDLKRGTLTVNRSLTQLSKKRGGAILEKPKTLNAYRRLQLDTPLLAELRRWKIACPPTPNELLFVNALGQPMSRKQNNHMMRACCERAGVAALSMNNLRHSFASQNLIAGVSELEVSEMMGHSDPGVTLKVYSRWAKNEKSDAHSRLSNRIMQAVEDGKKTKTV